MEPIQRILVAIGFSEYCFKTFEMAVSLANRYDSKLVAANVINVHAVEAISTIEAMGYEVRSEDYIGGIEQERLEQMKQYASATGFPEHRLKMIFRVGNPFDQLMKIIREEAVDMVVMGTKGRTNLPGVLVGSVAAKLFRHSPVTVVSRRPGRETGDHALR